MTQTRTVTVRAPSKTYEVTIRAGGFEELVEEQAASVPSALFALLSDRTVDALYGDRAEGALGRAGKSVVRVAHEPGEAFKTLDTVNVILTSLFHGGVDRSASVLVLGGGIPCDMGGFAAATFMRGLPFTFVPTSLVAQVDAAVGGKVGVNHPMAGKNMVGLFSQPEAVLVDPALLSTLPAREFTCGLAEVVKYGAALDRSLFETLEKDRDGFSKPDPQRLAPVIEACVQAKARVVETDETDRGTRGLLNLGHTFGHAIEGVVGDGTVRHGEAVSIGMVAAAHLSCELSMLARADADRLEELLAGMGLPIHWPAEVDPGAAVDKLLFDKKFAPGRLRLVLLQGLGQAVLRDDLTIDAIRDFLARFSNRQG